MALLKESTTIDWADCPLVEVVAGKVSGVPLFKGTRLPAETVLINYEAGSPVEEISETSICPKGRFESFWPMRPTCETNRARESAVRPQRTEAAAFVAARLEVITSRELGWDTLRNGDLLNAAETNGFEAMVTGDKNRSYQQNREGRGLALVILADTDWPTLHQNPAPIVAALGKATPGSFQLLTEPALPRRAVP